jgi:hypothetical protein
LAEISSRSKSPEGYFTEANKKIHFFPPGFTSISSKEDMPMNINIEGLPSDNQISNQKSHFVPPGCATFGRDSSVELLIKDGKSLSAIN